MCSIFGIFDTKRKKEEIMEYANRTIYRGPDCSRYVRIKNGHLVFHRLAIMGVNEKGMQPFYRNKKYVICNGEMYGFRRLKEQLKDDFTFLSDSDCEILIPMFEKYGIMMFNMLDSEFAMILYDDDKNEYIVARDPLGIRPLFYGYNDSDESYGFASEAKCLIELYDHVYPFPPGHYFYQGKFQAYNKVYYPRLYHNDSLDVVCKNIKDKLVEGVRKRLDSDSEVGYLLSGGLDSSLICSIASKLIDKPIKTFAIGMEGDAIDLKYAAEVAKYIGSIHTEVIMTKEDVINALEHVIYILETYDITTIRASVGMYLVCKYIHENTGIKVLLTGEISDELFGYKYTDFAPSAKEFQLEAIKRIKEIYMYDVLRADRCISSNSMESRVPFGDIDFVNYVMSINPELKLNKYNKGKYLLRKAFEEGDYLPYDILYREKAAFSDAVGHSMVNYLKEYAESLYGDDYLELCQKYDHARPFTKESLLYRDIFERFYPNKADMIKDFWMPNKEWKGCNVNDPSARVLSNYGDSGK